MNAGERPMADNRIDHVEREEWQLGLCLPRKTAPLRSCEKSLWAAD
jgi:hypothetical protein